MKNQKRKREIKGNTRGVISFKSERNLILKVEINETKKTDPDPSLWQTWKKAQNPKDEVSSSKID